jgi:hypothetical protein
MNTGYDHSGERKHVYAHAMWRTGSTALARCFLDNDDYLVFYEPFHEACGSFLDIDRVSQTMSDSQVNLAHPAWKGGYFDNYKLCDPLTGKPLQALYAPESAVLGVYGHISAASLEYIAACKRVARSQGKAAFFGFCRSGLQQRGLHTDQQTTSFYLWRDPIAQYKSYNWSENNYFFPQTVAQLCQNPRIRKLIRSVIGQRKTKLILHLINSPLLTWRGRADMVQEFVDTLSADECFSIFYLSHYLSRWAAREMKLDEFSVDGLARSRTQRDMFKTAYGVDIALLRQESRPRDQQRDARFLALQERVESAMSKQNLTARLREH